MDISMEILREEAAWKIVFQEPEQCLRTNWHGALMDERTFKQRLEEVAYFAKTCRPKFFLANTVDFDYGINQEMQKWHNDLLFPIFQEIGLKKMAIMSSSDLVTQISIEQTYENAHLFGFQTQFFDSEEAAWLWLNEL